MIGRFFLYHPPSFFHKTAHDFGGFVFFFSFSFNFFLLERLSNVSTSPIPLSYDVYPFPEAVPFFWWPFTTTKASWVFYYYLYFYLMRQISAATSLASPWPLLHSSGNRHSTPLLHRHLALYLFALDTYPSTTPIRYPTMTMCDYPYPS